MCVIVGAAPGRAPAIRPAITMLAAFIDFRPLQDSFAGIGSIRASRIWEDRSRSLCGNQGKEQPNGRVK